MAPTLDLRPSVPVHLSQQGYVPREMIKSPNCFVGYPTKSEQTETDDVQRLRSTLCPKKVPGSERQNKISIFI